MLAYLGKRWVQVKGVSFWGYCPQILETLARALGFKLLEYSFLAPKLCLGITPVLNPGKREASLQVCLHDRPQGGRTLFAVDT